MEFQNYDEIILSGPGIHSGKRNVCNMSNNIEFYTVEIVLMMIN